MSLDFSCATVNIYHIGKFKARTVRKMIDENPKDKPLVLDTRVESKVYLDGKFAIGIMKIGRYAGIEIVMTEGQLHQTFKYPSQIPEALDIMREKSPVFATWFMFNIKDFFGG